jgi:hypothetical protein
MRNRGFPIFGAPLLAKSESVPRVIDALLRIGSLPKQEERVRRSNFNFRTCESNAR